MTVHDWFKSEDGFVHCRACGWMLGTAVSRDSLCEGEPPLDDDDTHASPCNCDFHRGMTEDQAWITLP